MGGAAPRAATSDRPRPPPPTLRRRSCASHPPSFLRLSPSVIPAPPARHSCAGRNGGEAIGAQAGAGGRSVPPTPHLASPLKGGRDEFSWGRAWCVLVVCAGVRGSCLRPPLVIPAPLRRHSCAGRNPRTHAPSPLFPNSSLPPKRGEVRWGVRRPERAPAIVHAPRRRSARRLNCHTAHRPNRHSCAPLSSFLRRQEWGRGDRGASGRPALARRLPPPT